MNIQTITTKRNQPDSLGTINFGSTRFARTFAEQVQKASRVIYHSAYEDGKKGKCKLNPQAAQKIVDRVTLYAQMDECKDTTVLAQKIIDKLKELCNTALLDAANGVKNGWASATNTRRNLAEILKGDGFTKAAERLEENVCDNLGGDY